MGVADAPLNAHALVLKIRLHAIDGEPQHENGAHEQSGVAGVTSSDNVRGGGASQLSAEQSNRLRVAGAVHTRQRDRGRRIQVRAATDIAECKRRESRGVHFAAANPRPDTRKNQRWQCRQAHQA